MTKDELSSCEFVIRDNINNCVNYVPYNWLSSDGGGGGHSTCGAFSYDEDTHTIKDGLYLRARKWTAVANAVVATAGYAYLKIGMGTNGTAEVVTGQSSIPATDRYYMYIPLYIFDANLKITNDYRGAPTAQIWEYE